MTMAEEANEDIKAMSFEQALAAMEKRRRRSCGRSSSRLSSCVTPIRRKRTVVTPSAE